MIQRISQSDTPEEINSERPKLESDRNKMLFHKIPSLRKMVVVLDYSIVSKNVTNDPKIDLLIKLLARPYIDLYRYSDDGPLANAEKVKYKLSKFPGFVGWVVTYDEEEGRIPITSTLAQGSISLGAIVGDIHSLARNDNSTKAYQELSDDEASTHRYADAIAVRAAKYVNADLFITRRPYLYATKLPIHKNILIIQPEDSLPLVGLYLRTQGEYFLDSDDDRLSLITSRQDFYWTVSHEVLSQSWRLYTACFQHSEGTFNTELSMLEGAVHYRLCRVLQARDGVHVAVDDINSDENLIGELDKVLINLEGAMDAFAKITHHTLGITMERGYPAWQNDRWLSKFPNSSSDLYDLIKIGSKGKKLLKLLISLRNTIHGQSLHSLRIIDDAVDRNIGIRVSIPSDKQDEIINAANDLGGYESWGISKKSNMYFIEPDILVDKLIPSVIKLLDELIEKAPLEQLSQVSLSTEDCEPPRDSGLSIFLESSRKNARLQLGL
jgi:hypothetical protein